MVSRTGDGLCIVCEADPLPHCGWMAFALYHSAQWSLPDAGFVVSCAPGPMTPAFGWAFKRGVPFRCRAGDPAGWARMKFRSAERFITVPCGTIAAREYRPEDVGPIPASSGQLATFVGYDGGCGRFVPGEWIHNTSEPPFFQAVKRFGTARLTANELKVLQAWGRCAGFYSTMV